MNLEEIREKIETLAKMDDLTDDQVKELENLNKQARKMVAQNDATKAAADAKKQLEADREAEQDKKIAAAIKSEREKWEAENNRLPSFDGVAPYATKYADEAKYDSMDSQDLSFYLDVAHSLKAAKRARGSDFAISPAAFKAMSRRVAEFKGANNEEGRKQENYVKSAFKMGTATHIEPTVDGVEAAIKAATDPMYTGGSGVGSDWIGSLYSSNMWENVRSNVQILSKIPEMVIPDGYSNATIPLESTDFTVYKVAEVTAANATTGIPDANVTASQIGTTSKNVIIAKLGARGLRSGELDEDSLIRVAPEMRRKAEKSLTERLESALIDGDTETSANKNINDIAGTPAATDYFLVWDGFRKLALVTNTNNARNAGGVLVVEDYKDTLKLLGTAGLAGSDPSAVGFIQDFNVMWAAMSIPEIKTRDTFSPAVLEGGRISAIYRVPVYDSFFMHMQSNAAGYERKANTAGKVDVDTGSNNTTGSILAVRFDQWKFAYKRRLTIETTRFANSDSWEIVALMRCGLAYRDTEAAAISYNVGV